MSTASPQQAVSRDHHLLKQGFLMSFDGVVFKSWRPYWVELYTNWRSAGGGVRLAGGFLSWDASAPADAEAATAASGKGHGSAPGVARRSFGIARRLRSMNPAHLLTLSPSTSTVSLVHIDRKQCIKISSPSSPSRSWYAADVHARASVASSLLC
jgi:hypothetical protein